MVSSCLGQALTTNPFGTDIDEINIWRQLFSYLYSYGLCLMCFFSYRPSRYTLQELSLMKPQLRYICTNMVMLSRDKLELMLREHKSISTQTYLII